MLELLVQHAGKVTVETFVPRDELVGERQTGHETSLLEPENGAKGARKEDSLHHAKGDAPFGKAGILGVRPLKSPVGLALDTGNGINGVQEVQTFLRVLNIGINQQGIGFRVDVLHGNLESVKASSFGGLNLRHEILRQVFVDNAVRGRKKCQNVRDKVTLVVRQRVPIFHVTAKIDLFGRPEGGFCLLVHFPELEE